MQANWPRMAHWINSKAVQKNQMNQSQFPILSAETSACVALGEVQSFEIRFTVCFETAIITTKFSTILESQQIRIVIQIKLGPKYWYNQTIKYNQYNQIGTKAYCPCFILHPLLIKLSFLVYCSKMEVMLVSNFRSRVVVQIWSWTLLTSVKFSVQFVVTGGQTAEPPVWWQPQNTWHLYRHIYSHCYGLSVVAVVPFQHLLCQLYFHWLPVHSGIV